MDTMDRTDTEKCSSIPDAKDGVRSTPTSHSIRKGGEEVIKDHSNLSAKEVM